MPFKFQAPFPELQVTSLVPNPLFGDTESNVNTVDIKRSMNGATYSYVKTKDGRRKFVWVFRVSRMKALEMREFFNAFHSEKVKITTTDGTAYVGWFTSNPFEFEGLSRSLNSPGNEMYQFEIVFEGVQSG